MEDAINITFTILTSLYISPNITNIIDSAMFNRAL